MAQAFVERGYDVVSGGTDNHLALVDLRGKCTGKDAEAGKLTYPGVFGVERTRQIAGELHAEAVAALGPLGPSAAGLRSIADRLACRSA